MSEKIVNTILFLFVLKFNNVYCFPDQGHWIKSFDKANSAIFGIPKSLYAGSEVSLTVNCEPNNHSSKVEIRITWLLRQTPCYEEYLGPDILNPDNLKIYYVCPMLLNGYSEVRYLKSDAVLEDCSSRIHLEAQNLSFVTYSSKATQMPDVLPKECLKYIQEVPQAEGPSVTAVEPIKSKSDPSGGKASVLQPSEKNSVEKKRIRRSGDNINKVEKPDKKQLNTSKAEPNTKDTKTAEEHSEKGQKGDLERHDNLSDGKKTKITEKPKEHNEAVVGLLDMHKDNSKSGSQLAVVDKDGVYLFILYIESEKEELVNVTVEVKMKGKYGYLSAVDWPLLPFYGFMCGIYVLYAFAWLIVSALQWRDLLRIQFWIGGVIFLGLMEKAVFYAEYQSINSTGQSVQGAVLFAEILSCMKRTLARMLVIIVSLGFGIVKPRLGPMLHRVVGVGALYFTVGTIEGCLRVLKPKNDPSNQALMAGIPLAVMDSAICWWVLVGYMIMDFTYIFSSLVQTIRTLRLRRNLVKLSLYRHFTNTLIFAVLASVAYMVWSIHTHKLINCITDWKELWVDEAYWHLLFSVVLLVIMVLWRPTNNNQRYAFTPLLDAADDDEDEDLDLSPTNDAFAGMKMRMAKNQSSTSPKQNDAKNSKTDEDLKWVEENIPSSLTDTALPSLLDSDEEIMTTKFERSKME